MVQITVISGFSGSGKDSVMHELVQKFGYAQMRVYTTRPRRDGEGETYVFVNEDEFKELIHNEKLIEYRSYCTINQGKNTIWYYGTSKDIIGDKPIVVLDLQGLKTLKELYPGQVTSVFIHVHDDIRLQRAQSRGSFDEKEWARRLKDDYEKFNTDDINKLCDLVVENNNLDDTVHKIMSFLEP
jgi:guanylate kinase